MPGTSSREFFWTAEKRLGGRSTLEPKGNLKLPAAEFAASAEYLQKTQGPVPLSYTMPFDGFATLVVDDAQGHRVKNVIGHGAARQGQADRPVGRQPTTRAS